jgi:EAL and modified HD-GYP domain-containing signal transduction protein
MPNSVPTAQFLLADTGEMRPAIDTTDPLPSDPELFLGRQPIFDRSLQVYAYELLFRSENGHYARVHDDHDASATVIHHVFNKLGVNRVLGDYRGFINLNASLLKSPVIEHLPPERVVLEILETVPVDAGMVARCRALKEQGFVLALDDFTGHEAAFEPLLPLIDIVKVDLQHVGPERLPITTERLRRWPAMLLAEKVHHREQARQCMDLGYDLFQGYYLGKPHLLTFGHRPDSLAADNEGLIDVRRSPR